MAAVYTWLRIVPFFVAPVLQHYTVGCCDLLCHITLGDLCAT